MAKSGEKGMWHKLEYIETNALSSLAPWYTRKFAGEADFGDELVVASALYSREHGDLASATPIFERDCTADLDTSVALLDQSSARYRTIVMCDKPWSDVIRRYLVC
jgi:hypothetical protein